MKIIKAFLFGVLVACLSIVAFAQSQATLKRTTTKTDRLDFGVGGTVTIAGAPRGSISVEGWSNREIEITAEIEIEADSEADLALLSQVTTFLLEESLGRTGIISVGTHNKKYIKQLKKKMPKHLMGKPFRIDYKIKVPQYTDLQIDGGVGDLTISGVEGAIKLNYLETNARLDLKGGGLIAVFGRGKVDVVIPGMNWRGRFADIQLANGEMNVHLPKGINAELDATILREGRIENDFAGLTPRVRKAEFTDKSIVAKSGIGGIPLKFTVGDGTLRITNLESRLKASAF
jgi:hypothetical protein